ncbi:hypothetical protein GTO91_07965 [Heliobacterium undosum]|uniref:Uncharacterized protein n=1 Tax=Heliomicrobium undosum TaxID=121734 RepID=A0A845L3F3_9FIRM|nr:hypothetical protein [Heliomicrobium undosum]MZP29639.1 hypothetical protein [Heliomicrobium undosum]
MRKGRDIVGEMPDQLRMRQVLEAIKQLSEEDQQVLRDALRNIRSETPGIIVRVDDLEAEENPDECMGELIHGFIDLNLSLTAGKTKIVTSVFHEGYTQDSTIRLLYNPRFKEFLFPLH